MKNLEEIVFVNGLIAANMQLIKVLEFKLNENKYYDFILFKIMNETYFIHNNLGSFNQSVNLFCSIISRK